MTFMDYFETHGQRIYGSLTAGLSTVSALLASGAFQGLVSDGWQRGLAITFAVVTAMLGSATVSRASSVAGQVKVATAMQTAIQATPGDPLPASVTKLSEPKT